MISISKCRELIGPKGQDLTDQEVEEIREKLYELASLAFEDWWQQKIKNGKR